MTASPPLPSKAPAAMPEEQLHCGYYAAGKCRSCSLIETPYRTQLAAKEARCRELLPSAPEAAWLPAFSGGDRGFRNRAKLVVGGVGGSVGGVTLGILGPSGRGVDLRECAIQAPGIAAIIPVLADFIERIGLEPYSVPERRGELKFVHVTLAPDGELMLRFVTRSERGLAVLRSRLAELRRLVPKAAVISVNLLPEHKAVLEGEREVLLHGSTLAMRLDDVTLHLRPQSFFQTNTAVARELYRQVASWVAAADPVSVWDLYCGVGGFALHCAAAFEASASASASSSAPASVPAMRWSLDAPSRPREREVLGVEISGAAVDSARRSAREAGLAAHFLAADATEFALAAAPGELPELVIVNPPRRGIGEALASFLEESGVPRVVYSSCNPVSLAKDLALMPGYAVREARVFDMFPHTAHLEVAVLLERVG